MKNRSKILLIIFSVGFAAGITALAFCFAKCKKRHS